MEWSNTLLRHFKIQTLLKIICCMAAISAFRVTQHSQIFSLFFRNRTQCIALYQLHNSQVLINLCRGYYINVTLRFYIFNCLCSYFKAGICGNRVVEISCISQFQALPPPNNPETFDQNFCWGGGGRHLT